MSAQHAAIQSPRSASVCPAFDLQSLTGGAGMSGSAPPIVATERIDAIAQSEFRAMILAAMRDRRLSLIDRAAEAKANRQRKAHSICLAEVESLTRALMFMEARND